MNEQDYTRIGRDLKKAVNDALQNMDFSGLNETISRSVREVTDDLTGRLNKSAEAMGDRVKNTADRFGDTMRDKSGFVGDVLKESIDALRESVFGTEDGRKAARPKDRDTGNAAESRGSKSGQAAQGRTFTDSGVWDERPVVYGRTPGLAGGLVQAIVGGSIGFGTALPILIMALVSIFGGIHPTGFTIASSILLPFAIAGGIFFRRGMKLLGWRNRFRNYRHCIGTRTVCSIASLARAAGKSEAFTRQELEEMIRKGLFLQGHLDDEKTCLMLTDETYAMYRKLEETRAQMDREAAGKSREESGKAAAEARTEEAEAAEKELDPAVAQAVREGQEYIRMIRSANDRLPGEEISAKLDKLERVIGLIYIRLQKKPEKYVSMKRFTDYYLPTTMKLVEAYCEFDENQMDTEKILKSKDEIEQTLDSICVAFERMLDSLYEDDLIDLNADIQVLKTLLAQEGYGDGGLGMDDIFEDVSGVRSNERQEQTAQ